MSEIPTAWQDEEIARIYIEERRAAVPFGAEMLTVVEQILGWFQPKVQSILDIGAGDGFFTQVVLKHYPDAHAILVDHSQPMLNRASANLAGLGERITYLEADLGNSLSELVPVGSIDLVISRFAIHHLPDDRKHTLYGEIFDALRPGGWFLHNEHVTSASPRLESLCDSIFIDRISTRTGRARSMVSDEFYGRLDRLDNKLASVETQVGQLRELGFEQVDCYFKWLELAVFGGCKPQ